MGPSIPANAIVSVNPSVISAGGSALDLNGLILSSAARVPMDTVRAFSSAADVSSYFGASSVEAALATIYFNGFDNSNAKPGSILFAQYNQSAVPAFLRGGSLAAVSLSQLQGYSGTITLTADGYQRVSSNINLAGVSSFSAAAAQIQTALNTALPQQASFTGSIATTTAGFVGSIIGNILTVTSVGTGALALGAVLGTAGGIAANTQVTGLGTGTGGAGTYYVNQSQNVVSQPMTATYGTLTVTAVASGSISSGQTAAGSGVSANTLIWSQLSGSIGGTGTYTVSPSQAVVSGAMTSTATGVSVTFDPVTSAFLITSGIVGSISTMTFGSGALATNLLLTQATGAVTSIGSNVETPSVFMSALVQETQNWATFMTAFDPDNGSGNSQKYAFAQWTGQQNNRYAYICTDQDVSPTTAVPAAACLGQLILAAGISGVCLIYQPTTSSNIYGAIAAFICGTGASIDFTQTNGRITFAFKSQSGLVADVTNQTVAANLGGNPQSIGDFGNGYNYYGTWATANDQFTFFNRGAVSGKFEWLDSYLNQIWLNNAFQLALIELLINVLSIPYNSAGYALIEAACADVINQGLNFGAFRAGVTLSAAQTAEVNNAAGKNIATILQQRGWYLLVQDATPQVRAARASPPMTFWYMDGQSVQAINLASVAVQ